MRIIEVFEPLFLEMSSVKEEQYNNRTAKGDAISGQRMCISADKEDIPSSECNGNGLNVSSAVSRQRATGDRAIGRHT